MAVVRSNSSARRSRAYRERMRAAGYRAAEVWHLDTTNAEVRARVEQQLHKLSGKKDDADWMVEPEFADWR